MRARVMAARERQVERAGKPNSALTAKEIERDCPLAEADYRLLEQALERLGLSPRAYDRILKVARTIADLAGSEAIQTAHLTEAIGYRALERRLRPLRYNVAVSIPKTAAVAAAMSSSVGCLARRFRSAISVSRARS